jgi:GxxExxY protein
VELAANRQTFEELIGHGFNGSTRIVFLSVVEPAFGDTMVFEGKHSDLKEKIIGCFFSVYNQLGYGFSEKIYENAMVIELQQLGLKVEQQKPIIVYYHGQVVGEYFMDMIVKDVVIVELKAVRRILSEHEAQLLNYLKATSIEVGLLLNFGPKARHIRKTYDNNLKGSMKWVQTN